MLWLTVAVAGVGAVLMLVLVAMLMRMKRLVKQVKGGILNEEDHIYDEIEIKPSRVDAPAGKGIYSGIYEDGYMVPKISPFGKSNKITMG